MEDPFYVTTDQDNKLWLPGMAPKLFEILLTDGSRRQMERDLAAKLSPAERKILRDSMREQFRDASPAEREALRKERRSLRRRLGDGLGDGRRGGHVLSPP